MLLNWKRKSTPHKSPEEKQQEYIEQIEELAWKLYENQYSPGKKIDKDEIRQTAGKIARSRRRKLLFACHRPFIRLEKGILEPLLTWANNQALLSLLGVMGNVGIIIAVVTYVGSEKQRRDAEVLNAWQTLTSAHGQAGSGGRIQALEFLNASPGANWRRKFPWFCAPHPLCTWPAESLDGINLGVEATEGTVAEQGDRDASGDQEASEGDEDQWRERPGRVYLVYIQLPGARLWEANLQEAYLGEANLEGAVLGNANLQGAELVGANLQEAYLWGANLQGANLGNANLEGAVLGNANLEGAVLGNANLEGAELVGANLQEAYLGNVNLQGAYLGNVNLEEASLWNANLQGASLWNANLEGAELVGANLQEAENTTQDQLTQAKLCFTQFPDGITLDPNRDCEELGIDPETGEVLPIEQPTPTP